ncbi:BTAD domain-containing putative transcriptional regulator [Pseudonocardia hispaniensis]|uniref:BTAD domain-containing putative transcriptional regulator n=1 Tax=Pseudonocardia hispaniensis TaxID=904933 RepID=A0ABW1J0X5_9PSEU
MTDGDPRLFVLGPLAVRRDDGRVVALTGRRDRSLLAGLLAHRNEAVSARRLIDGAWGPDAGIGANTLQARVSHLRRLLGAQRLVHAGEGYLLRVPTGDCDEDVLVEALGRAQALLGGGGAAEAAQLLETALALVRGTPYAPCEDEPLVVAAAARAQDLVWSARELYARAVLDAGDHVRAAALARALVVAEPARQDARVVLMHALDRQGRRAEALAVFEDARRTLADVAGLEPAPLLRAAHAEILASEHTAVRSESAGPGVLHPPDMIRWLARNGHAEAALALAVRCAWGWWLAGERGRGRRLLAELLAAPPGDGTTGSRSAARLWAAALAVHERDEPAALGDAERALAEQARAPIAPTAIEALALLLIADRRTERGEPEAAARALTAAAPALGGDTDRWACGLATLVEARGLLGIGRPAEAGRLATEALRVFAGLPDAAGQLSAHELLGCLAQGRGELPAAADHFRRSLLLALHGGWPHAQCLQLMRLGGVTALLGDVGGARQRLAEALAIARRVDSPSLVAYVRTNLALVDARAGDTEPAARGHREALAWYQHAGSVSGIALNAAALARLVPAGRAEALLDRAERAAAASGDARAMAFVAESRAVTAASDELAVAHLRRARELRGRTGWPRLPGEQPDVDRLERRLRP